MGQNKYNNNEVFYHEAWERKGIKMMMVMGSYGVQGYGMWWILIEMIAESHPDNTIDLSSPNVVGYMAAELRVTPYEFRKFIEYLSSPEIQLLQTDGKQYWCSDFNEKMRSLTIRRKTMSKRGSIGAYGTNRKRWGYGTNVITTITGQNQK